MSGAKAPHHQPHKKKGCGLSTAAIGTDMWRVGTYDLPHVLKHCEAFPIAPYLL
jgi:hypothetical protein